MMLLYQIYRNNRMDQGCISELVWLPHDYHLVKHVSSCVLPKHI